MPITIVTPVRVQSKKEQKQRAANKRKKQIIKQIIGPIKPTKRKTNKVLINNFKQKGIKGYSKLKRPQLLIIDDLINMTVVNIKKTNYVYNLPRNIKKKIDIINYIIKNEFKTREPTKINIIHEEVLQLMRTPPNRVYRDENQRVLQNEIYPGVEMTYVLYGTYLIDDKRKYTYTGNLPHVDLDYAYVNFIIKLSNEDMKKKGLYQKLKLLNKLLPNLKGEDYDNKQKEKFEILAYQEKVKDELFKTEKMLYIENGYKYINKKMSVDLPKEVQHMYFFKHNYNRLLHDYLTKAVNSRRMKKGNGVVKYKFINYNGGDEVTSPSALMEYTADAIQLFKDGNLISIEDLKYKFGTSSNATTTVVGWQLLIEVNDSQKSPQVAQKLLAFHPSTERKFHALTSASTTLNKICIYESFLHTCTDYNLMYKRNREETNYDLMKQLKEEGENIYNSVINGELIESITALCIKYNVPILIEFYNEIYFIIITQKGKVINIDENNYKDNEKYLNKFIDQKSLLYDKIGQHVAPTIFKGINISDEQKKIKKNITFKLRPQKLKPQKKIICDVYGYDIETYRDTQGDSIMYNITLVGKMNIDIKKINHNDDTNIIKKSFYGEYSLVNFCTYLNHIADKSYYFKSRPKESIKKIYIFGFNNSNFDNLFIYDMLHNLNVKTKYVIANSSIKSIKFNNINIIDISLFYSLGGLRGTCGAFQLKEEKGVFPYKFVNEDNLYYYGDVPELKYWNSKEDMDEYIKENGDKFDMKEYTEKYCLLDSKLVYRLSLYHLENTTGTLKNGRNYNTLRAITAAKTALLTFSQGFQNDILEQSPDKIIVDERAAYHGGRTEKFRNEFIYKGNDRYARYVDLNSSYPFSMTKKQPFKYIRSLPCDVTYTKKNIKDIVPYNLYKCKFEYKGDDKYFIPNLLVVSEKTKNIIPVKKSLDKSYWFWGCELIEAVLNNCHIYCEEVHIYEGKAIFKEYVEYFYSERQINDKEGNKSAALFKKLLLNALYGIMGKRPNGTSGLTNEASEIWEITKKNNGILTNFKFTNEKIIYEYSTEQDEYKIGTLVRFSSFIAAQSRSTLSEFMRVVNHKNCIYGDTDSLIYEEDPNKPIPQQYFDKPGTKELGKWKFETKTAIDHAILIQPKTYYYHCLDGKSDKKAKGIKAERLTVEDYENLVNGGVVKQTNLTFFKKITEATVNIQEQERSLKMINSKRKWEGNESYAFDTIEEWTDNYEYIKNENDKLKKLNKSRNEIFFTDEFY